MLPTTIVTLRRWAGLALLVGALCSCRYNFVPVVPTQAALTLPVRITAASLRRGAGGLAVDAQVLTPRSGYLSVVWYSQDTELGRDSVYVEAATGTPRRPLQVHFAWPLGVAANTAYRAMLLFEGDLLREVDEKSAGEQSVPAAPPSVPVTPPPLSP